ncbi:transcriptional regulator, TetR family [Streptomyces sp. yr375]|uniref:TetR/AcrR family transcriptional regulator n=1 Tax=Streptomyces sp. yr375 TaxID=1761906 RepID=UPI0008BE4F39|nr:TetR/AcrR family transcriptional regulator [Streptomyces sp. yr375]SER48655.1 transcriptional regulator, TetR family [Streptomyces sp. yr375]
MTASGGRTGRPPLTDERKAQIRLEIARAAVDLFVGQGVAATTGEQIGQAVGVSARTVWRYFPSKESCVRPLLTAGIDTIAARLREWRPGRPPGDVLARLDTDERVIVGPDPATVGALVRLTRTEPGLRAVWLQTYDEAEPVFARALADRAGRPVDDLRPAIQAAMFNAALRAAVEHHAWHADAPTMNPTTARADLAEAVRTAFEVASEGLV